MATHTIDTVRQRLVAEEPEHSFAGACVILRCISSVAGGEDRADSVVDAAVEIDAASFPLFRMEDTRILLEDALRP